MIWPTGSRKLKLNVINILCFVISELVLREAELLVPYSQSTSKSQRSFTVLLCCLPIFYQEFFMITGWLAAASGATSLCKNFQSEGGVLFFSIILF